MATVTRRDNKNGKVAFRVQVYSKNKATGKATTKVATWVKPIDMTERDAKKELIKFVMEFEESIKRENDLLSNISCDIKLIDYLPIWLEEIRTTTSLSYYASAVKLSEYIGTHIGNYKLKELNPMRIQKFINDLDDCKLKRRKAIAKPLLKTLFDELNVTRDQLSNSISINRRTIGAALLGRAIESTSAMQLAKVFALPFEELFSYKSESTDLSQSSKSRYCRTLRAILSTAKRKQLITENYAKGEYVKLIAEPKSKVECMNELEIKLFIKGLQSEEDIRIKSALTIAVLMGLRRGEICGLQWEDIDFESETICIERSSIQISGYGIITGSPKTESSKRVITMPHALTVLLKDYKTFWDMYAERLPKAKINNRLFLQGDGSSLNPGTIRYWLEKSLAKYGINNHYSVHSLRHSNITMQILSGVPLKTVSSRAGHSSTKVTSEVYSHFMRSSDIEAANKLNAMFE